ncbi:site-specific DNA-methyltransferase [Mycoplasma feriruminatoris]|uniref:site-specific DNA-methyltransferase n=1 Tax=Mycoplasma feriruminatoris TaxID=1179777 RepID=UPI00241F2C7B|nr:site-specific DNA-methyltransferase [Mycoplasma feriruminatoris]WFQ94683.1 hypothetical protein MFERI15220_00765 [Mycoplasma feriruminatoris]
MLKENILKNQQIKPSSNKIEKLKKEFPEFFIGEDFQIDKFQELLKNNEINIGREGYELKFLGKSYSRYLSSTKSETFIAPHIEDNNKLENSDSENLYVIGDNLDALKHLLGSYAGKIKCIYIDPPYNTGSDGFIYPDNFSFSAEELSEKIGIDEQEAQRIIDLKGKNSHSAWMTFMYPRLVLARDLLSDDGVIFISIDDNEQANLKLICDEIFGEDNFLTNIIWERNSSPVNLMKHFSRSHDFILCYAKNSLLASNRGVERTEEIDKKYKNPDADPRGSWIADNLSVGPAVEANIYPITTPSGRIVYPPNGRSWRVSKEKFNEMIRDNRITFGSDGKGKPKIKRFLEELKKEGVTPTTLWSGKNVGSSTTATNYLQQLFNGNKVFDYPKPVKLIKQLISLYSDKDSIFLDFFSGSATMAEAVMEMNAKDCGNRNYILVQLDEQIKETQVSYKLGYRTIDEIGRERIKRAAAKIKNETSANIDYGFKTYSLKTPTEKMLNELDYFNENISFNFEDNVSIFDNDKSSGKDAILSTYSLLDGYGLTEKIEEYKLKEYTANKIKNTLYIIEQGLTSEDLIELIRQLESNKLNITRVVVFGSSIDFNILIELKNNLSNLKNTTIELVERY